MMNEFFESKWVEVFSILFGAGGIGYAIITHALQRKKYDQEVREQEATADLKSEDFWKGRYEVLQQEIETKNDWWKDRYEALYEEFQTERTLSNQIVSSFRNELNEMRNEYEQQREMERKKYKDLLESYQKFEEESRRRELEYRARIAQLEKLVDEYEVKLSSKKL